MHVLVEVEASTPRQPEGANHEFQQCCRHSSSEIRIYGSDRIQSVQEAMTFCSNHYNILDVPARFAHQTYCCVFCVHFGCCHVGNVKKKSQKVRTFQKKYAKPHLTSVLMGQTPPICYSKYIKTNRKNSCTVAFFFFHPGPVRNGPHSPSRGVSLWPVGVPGQSNKPPIKKSPMKTGRPRREPRRCRAAPASALTAAEGSAVKKKKKTTIIKVKHLI